VLLFFPSQSRNERATSLESHTGPEKVVDSKTTVADIFFALAACSPLIRPSWEGESSFHSQSER
jgi:hypothetical protein